MVECKLYCTIAHTGEFIFSYRDGAPIGSTVIVVQYFFQSCKQVRVQLFLSCDRVMFVYPVHIVFVSFRHGTIPFSL